MKDDVAFPLYRAACCGLLAMLVAIGIARFGYAPLVPALVAGHWFSASAAFWQGTTNLGGYLIGAAGMRVWSRPVHTRPAVAGLMAVTALSLIASAWDGGEIYQGFWRLLTGITGGALMVLMAAAVVGRAPPAKRGQVGGITFAGMGTGIMVSGLLIPRLLPLGLPATWALLGGFGLIAAVFVGVLMPPAIITPAVKSAEKRVANKPVTLLIIGYALCAFGFVPHMLFLASFVAIGLHRGIVQGADIASALGVAAAIGPPVLGRIADRFGFLRTLAWGYLVMAASVAMPLFTGSTLGLTISAIGVGAMGLGAVLLTSGAIAHLVHPSRLAANWGLATMTYAVCQAGVAALFSSLFHATGSYQLLFGIGAVAAFGSALIVFAAEKSASHVDVSHGA
jgi:predicted MFS family arabinose efflux permease